MDRNRMSYEQLQRQTAEQTVSPAGAVLYGIVVIYAIHQILAYFDYAILPPQELLWNAVVWCLPKYNLLDTARRQELKANGMLSQTHAAKSDALRRMLGLGGNAVLQKLPSEGIMRRASTGLFSRPKVPSDAPPGLGNWDNSCYQNSVLQGLTSLDSLKPYLERTVEGEEMEGSTSGSLLETVAKLKNADNNGKQLWTPAKLKSMSSWQQQDAQEYFSKIMDELDKEAAKAGQQPVEKPGLETIAEEKAEKVEKSDAESDIKESATRNPMEGMLAQKVACTRCGFSEGLSMIPFNCLTVPLGSDFAYDLDEGLDEYTKLEEITDVECAKCTLLRAEKQLTAMLPPPPSNAETEPKPEVDEKVLALPPELRAQAFKRLAAIQKALETDDFEDKTISEKCEIGKKARVSSTKTRQAVVARAPRSLVVHVNRSVFDEMTGVQRKNYASVRWPGELDLGAWMLKAGDRVHGDGTSLLNEDGLDHVETWYRIKAVVTHYGRHENGHYIAYRRHPVHLSEEAVTDGDADAGDKDTVEQQPDKPTKELQERWWRLSDEDVSSVTEDEVLAQGGVFMLFYERIEEDDLPADENEGLDVAASEMASQLIVDETSTTATAEATIQHSEDEALQTLPKPEPEAATASIAHAHSEETIASAPLASPSQSTGNENEIEQTESGANTPSLPAKKPPTPPLMRTARGRQASKSEGFGGMSMRPMAAT